jgi:hypothetical protein
MGAMLHARHSVNAAELCLFALNDLTASLNRENSLVS